MHVGQALPFVPPLLPYVSTFEMSGTLFSVVTSGTKLGIPLSASSLPPNLSSDLW